MTERKNSVKRKVIRNGQWVYDESFNYKIENKSLSRQLKEIKFSFN